MGQALAIGSMTRTHAPGQARRGRRRCSRDPHETETGGVPRHTASTLCRPPAQEFLQMSTMGASSFSAFEFQRFRVSAMKSGGGAHRSTQLDDANIRNPGLPINWHVGNALDPLHNGVRKVWHNLCSPRSTIIRTSGAPGGEHRFSKGCV